MLRTTTQSLALVSAALLGSWVSSPSQQGPAPESTVSTTEEPQAALAHYRGIAAPVRGSSETTFSNKTKTVSFEAYRDWDFGTVTFVSETGSLAVVPAPQNWEIRTASVSSGMVAICFVPSTGLSWMLTEEKRAQKWEPIGERGKLDLGDYDIEVSAGPDGITALRFDRYSGRSWSYSGVAWVPLVGNVEGWPGMPQKREQR